jgi:hypothetical protein
MAFKTFANGFPLPASDLNNFLMKQSVIVFADVAARSAALPEPIEGMVTYLEDDNELYKWTGADWVNVAPTPDLTSLIPKSTVTTAGDLIIADGASSVTRLGVGSEGSLLKVDSGTLAYLAAGTDNQVLTLASGTPTWADPAGGGGMTLISSSTPSGTFFTVSSIPSGYKQLMVKFYQVTQSVDSQITFRLNASTNDAYHAMPTSGSATFFTYKNTYLISQDSAFTPASNNANNLTVIIDDYDQSRHKSYHYYGGFSNRGLFGGGIWQNTAAITSIQFVSMSSIFTGGTIEIWGVN